MPGRPARSRLQILAAGTLLLMAAACREKWLPHRAAAGARLVPSVPRIAVGDVVVGRAATGRRVWLLTAGRRLYTLDMSRPSARDVAVEGFEPDDAPWGLARTADASLWTLARRQVLARLSERGRIVERLPLSRPYASVFGAGGRLVYQVADFDPPAPALVAGAPGGSRLEPWGPLETRLFPRPRAESMALNLVACGLGDGSALPCWFVGDTLVAVSDGRGGRQVPLEKLVPLAPEEVLAGESARRPIRDAAIGGAGEIWVLSWQDPTEDAPTGRRSARSGAQFVSYLRQYTAEGALRRVVPLPEPGRLILALGGSSAYILTGDGLILEVPL